MEQQNSYEREWAKGYADGFLLSCFEPEIASQLPKMDSMKSPFLKGLSSGIEQYNRRREFLASLAKNREENTATTKPRRR